MSRLQNAGFWGCPGKEGGGLITLKRRIYEKFTRKIFNREGEEE
jgi:hypothetical protein